MVTKPVLTGNMSPLEWALAELDKLQKQDLPAINQVKQHYQLLTNICRQYFSTQVHHAALHQTTDEWMVNLQSLPTEPGVKTSFFQLLRLADTVKFAKYLPPTDDTYQTIPVARQMLRQVSQLQKAL